MKMPPVRRKSSQGNTPFETGSQHELIQGGYSGNRIADVSTRKSDDYQEKMAKNEKQPNQ